MLNYIGPNNGQGIRMYHNGEQVASDTGKTGITNSAGDGRIVVGRYYTNADRDYATVQVDELIFFNQSLSVDEIRMLYDEN